MDEETTPSLPTINSINVAGTDYQIEDTVARKRAEAGLSGETVLNAFYPIGCIYQSFDPASPAELFGGEWEQLENVFLRAGIDTDTGGSDAITLTAAQMPSHEHSVGLKSCGEESSGFGLTQSVSFANNVIIGGRYWEWDTSTSGNSSSFSIMPSYQNVYTWKRVA